MSNIQNNENKAGAAQSKRPIAPDGKSPLPDSLQDSPAPGTGGGGDSGPTSGPAPK